MTLSSPSVHSEAPVMSREYETWALSGGSQRTEQTEAKTEPEIRKMIEADTES